MSYRRFKLAEIASTAATVATTATVQAEKPGSVATVASVRAIEVTDLHERLSRIEAAQSEQGRPMSVISLERRLRKLEATRGSKCGPWFFIWGRTEAEIDAAVTALPEKPADLVRVVWRHSEEVPAPRWAGARDLTEREMLTILEDRAGPRAEWSGGEHDPRVQDFSEEELFAIVLAPSGCCFV